MIHISLLFWAFLLYYLYFVSSINYISSTSSRCGDFNEEYFEHVTFKFHCFSLTFSSFYFYYSYHEVVYVVNIFIEIAIYIKLFDIFKKQKPNTHHCFRLIFCWEAVVLFYLGFLFSAPHFSNEKNPL